MVKAFVVDKYGRGTALRLGEMPTPELREDEVLAEVYAAGVNLLDSKTRSGEFKPGGMLISISGPPDADFAEEIGLPWFMKLLMSVLSFGVRRKAKRHDMRFSFLFMKASGSQLRQITSLIDSGRVRPVVDRIFPFASTNEALAFVEKGRAKGKAVVKVK